MLGLLSYCKKKPPLHQNSFMQAWELFCRTSTATTRSHRFCRGTDSLYELPQFVPENIPSEAKKKHESNYLSLSCLFPPQREEKKVIAFISMRINLIEDFLMIVLFFSPNPDTPYHRSTHLSPLLFSPYLPQISHPQLVSPTHTHPLVLSFHLAL